MNEQEIANSILQDIAKLPIAKYLLNLAIEQLKLIDGQIQYLVGKSEFKDLYAYEIKKAEFWNWLINGTYIQGILPKDTLSNYSKDSESTITNLVKSIIKGVTDRSPVAPILVDFVKENFTSEEIGQLAKQFKLIHALYNIKSTIGAAAYANIFDDVMAEILLTGKTERWLSGVNWLNLYFDDPEALADEIVEIANAYDEHKVVSELLSYTHRIEYDEGEEIGQLFKRLDEHPEEIDKFDLDKLLTLLLEEISKELRTYKGYNPEDITEIYNHFHPAPQAPEAPNVFKTYR